MDANQVYRCSMGPRVLRSEMKPEGSFSRPCWELIATRSEGSSARIASRKGAAVECGWQVLGRVLEPTWPVA